MGLQEGARRVSEGDGKVSGCGSEGSSGLNLMRFKVYKVTFVFLLILNLFFLMGCMTGYSRTFNLDKLATCLVLLRMRRGCVGCFINHTA